jgi:succinate dehydrogenase/fumarate reductase cytochrome b subunit
MLSCVVVSIVSFLVVLSALKWNLMSNNIANKTSFVHSICGLATLALMLIQVKLEFNFKKEFL